MVHEQRFSKTLPQVAELYCNWIVVAVLTEFTIVGVLKARYRLLWLDEIMGALIARLPNFSQIWSICKSGADNQPPLYHFAMWTSVRVFSNDALGLRIPSVFGYVICCLCLYLFVGRGTSSRLYGLVAMLFPGLTHYWWYATEGRPYALVLACVGVAAVCWQFINRDRHRTWMLFGLALSFLCALNLHYFSVLLILPFGLAEIVRSTLNKKIDPAVWLAISLPYLALIFYIPVILASKAHSGIPYAPFSKPYLYTSFERFTSEFFGSSLPFLIFFGVLCLALRFSPCFLKTDRVTPDRNMLIPEAYLVLSLVVLPVFAVFFAKYGTHIFFTRYAMAGVFGVAALVGYGAWLAFSGHRGLALVLASTALALILFTQDRDDLPLIREGRHRTANDILHRLPQVVLDDELPIVATNLDDYMIFYYYLHNAKLQKRLFYVSSETLAEHYIGFTLSDRMMIGSAPFFHTQVLDYKSFIERHSIFYVFGSLEYSEWVVPKLLADHADLELLQGGPSDIFGGFPIDCLRARITAPQ